MIEDDYPPDPNLPLDRVPFCVCVGAKLAEIAQIYSSAEEAEINTGCGTACGLCRPYLLAHFARKNRT